MRIEVYDPPMCCSTGVCGPSFDPELVRFAADIDWLKRKGIEVERYSLSQQPSAFANNLLLREALTRDGNDCLPLTVADGKVVCMGHYPTREELAGLAGIETRVRAPGDETRKTSGNRNTVRIFMLPKQNPCGPQATCCGPVGQSEAEIKELKSGLEKELSCRVEVLDVSRGADMKKHLPILRLVRSMGARALPIIALDDEVVALGMPSPSEAVSAVREKMNQK